MKCRLILPEASVFSRRQLSYILFAINELKAIVLPLEFAVLQLYFKLIML